MTSTKQAERYRKKTDEQAYRKRHKRRQEIQNKQQ